MNKLLVFLSILFFVVVISCEKDELNTSPTASLHFSSDTILFDTVFTTIGSATQYFTVKNPYNESIRISSIRLAGGSNSSYRLNIDGFSGNLLEKNIGKNW